MAEPPKARRMVADMVYTIQHPVGGSENMHFHVVKNRNSGPAGGHKYTIKLAAPRRRRRAPRTRRERKALKARRHVAHKRAQRQLAARARQLGVRAPELARADEVAAALAPVGTTFLGVDWAADQTKTGRLASTQVTAQQIPKSPSAWRQVERLAREAAADLHLGGGGPIGRYTR